MALTPRDAVAVGGATLAAVALGAAAWLAISPEPGGPLEATAPSPSIAGTASGGQGASSPAASGPGELLVDVQGAVAHPGIVRLAPGARVADAIAAAGGYTSRTDLMAAASRINLAAALADGGQVFVPILGVAAAGTPGAGGSGGGAADGRLVNLNSASPEELDALPGIGPVTVQKIVAARAERPFATLDELIEREVMNRGQLEDIRDLVSL